MSTLTSTSTLDDPTPDTTSASDSGRPTLPDHPTTAPSGQRAPVRLLGRLGQFLLEAASLPSHPYLVSAVGPQGNVLWIENRRLTSAA